MAYFRRNRTARRNRAQLVATHQGPQTMQETEGPGCRLLAYNLPQSDDSLSFGLEKGLKRLWVTIGETWKRPMSTSAGRWWLAWVSGGRKWALGSNNATNVACLAVFDPSTNSALSRLLEHLPKKTRSHSFQSCTLDIQGGVTMTTTSRASQSAQQT